MVHPFTDRAFRRLRTWYEADAARRAVQSKRYRINRELLKAKASVKLMQAGSQHATGGYYSSCSSDFEFRATTLNLTMSGVAADACLRLARRGAARGQTRSPSRRRYSRRPRRGIVEAVTHHPDDVTPV